MKTLNIGRDFSPDPIGRYRSDGSRSGETFREDYLKPALASLSPNEKLVVIIDDLVESYGSSFLSEGFAGLIKYGFITKEDFHNKIEIKYTNEDFEFFKTKIIEYVDSAKYNSKSYVPTKS